MPYFLPLTLGFKVFLWKPNFIINKDYFLSNLCFNCYSISQFTTSYCYFMTLKNYNFINDLRYYWQFWFKNYYFLLLEFNYLIIVIILFIIVNFSIARFIKYLPISAIAGNFNFVRFNCYSIFVHLLQFEGFMSYFCLINYFH